MKGHNSIFFLLIILIVFLFNFVDCLFNIYNSFIIRHNNTKRDILSTAYFNRFEGRHIWKAPSKSSPYLKREKRTSLAGTSHSPQSQAFSSLRSWTSGGIWLPSPSVFSRHWSNRIFLFSPRKSSGTRHLGRPVLKKEEKKLRLFFSIVCPWSKEPLPLL